MHQSLLSPQGEHQKAEPSDRTAPLPCWIPSVYFPFSFGQ